GGLEARAGWMGTWRKAYGALKDSTLVGLAKVNSEFKVRNPFLNWIFVATSATRPRADIAYCIYALGKRLSKTRNWTVAVKTLIVIHRTLREGDPTFREELLSYSRRGSILQISNFKDDLGSLGWFPSPSFWNAKFQVKQENFSLFIMSRFCVM
ncbi:hypothetical protein B296_00046882, partial [Ensete ventricosum]